MIQQPRHPPLWPDDCDWLPYPVTDPFTLSHLIADNYCSSTRWMRRRLTIPLTLSFGSLAYSLFIFLESRFTFTTTYYHCSVRLESLKMFFLTFHHDARWPKANPMRNPRRTQRWKLRHRISQTRSQLLQPSPDFNLLFYCSLMILFSRLILERVILRISPNSLSKTQHRVTGRWLLSGEKPSAMSYTTMSRTTCPRMTQKPMLKPSSNSMSPFTTIISRMMWLDRNDFEVMVILSPSSSMACRHYQLVPPVLPRLRSKLSGTASHGLLAPWRIRRVSRTNITRPWPKA